jgi:LacI family transcriptional regulator
MRRSSTNIVGVLLAGFDPFGTEVVKGISAVAGGQGYQLMAYSGAIANDAATGWERRSLLRLGGYLIDAAIVLTPSIVLPDTGIPVVTIDPRTGAGGPPAVACDSLPGAVAATRHLIGLGHTRIAHIRGRTDLTSALVREHGYCQALAEAGLPYDPRFIRDGGYRRDWSSQAAFDLLSGPDRPTAVFAANDASALGVFDAARELGISVPGDLSVVGFDDIPESTAISPQLTTVAQPMAEMGAQAWRMVMALLRGESVDQTVHLDTELIIRGSTCAPQAATRPVALAIHAA